MAESNDEFAKPLWGHVLTTGFFRAHGRYGYALSKLVEFVIACEDAHIDRDRQLVFGHRLLGLLRDEKFDESEKLLDELSGHRSIQRVESR